MPASRFLPVGLLGERENRVPLERMLRGQSALERYDRRIGAERRHIHEAPGIDPPGEQAYEEVTQGLPASHDSARRWLSNRDAPGILPKRLDRCPKCKSRGRPEGVRAGSAEAEGPSASADRR